MFEHIYGLKVNVEKSTLLCINVNQDQVLALASLLNSKPFD